jgi:hypothetical protein
MTQRSSQQPNHRRTHFIHVEINCSCALTAIAITLHTTRHRHASGELLVYTLAHCPACEKQSVMELQPRRL